MYVSNIPNPILQDMLTTLKGDTPILVGRWSFNKSYLDANDPKEKINVKNHNGYTNMVYEKPVACGCLMMDNHVEEYYSADNYCFNEAYFLADIYTKKLQHSKYYRGYELDTAHIDDFAKQFDNWAQRYRNTAYIFGKGIYDVLNDDARKELIKIIRNEINMRRKDPSLHQNVLMQARILAEVGTGG